MVEAEAATEAGVASQAVPALADGGGAREGGRQRRQADEDLPEHIVRQIGGIAAATDAAGQFGANLLAGVHLWMETRAASACFQYLVLDLRMESQWAAAGRSHSGGPPWSRCAAKAPSFLTGGGVEWKQPPRSTPGVKWRRPRPRAPLDRKPTRRSYILLFVLEGKATERRRSARPPVRRLVTIRASESSHAREWTWILWPDPLVRR